MVRWSPFVLLGVLAGGSCKIEPIAPARPFADDFNRPQLGESWRSTGSGYQLRDGELVVDHAYNHPLWLTQPLADNAVIEVDCWSNDPAGDIKLEAWGDGHSFATAASYTATSYVFIFGGWHNQLSAIARMNEHGADRRVRADRKVEPGRHYHFRIARQGGHIDWQIDGQPFLTFDDPQPLLGSQHAFVGFNDWEAELHFDNLKISPR